MVSPAFPLDPGSGLVSDNSTRKDDTRLPRACLHVSSSEVSAQAIKRVVSKDAGGTPANAPPEEPPPIPPPDVISIADPASVGGLSNESYVRRKEPASEEEHEVAGDNESPANPQQPGRNTRLASEATIYCGVEHGDVQSGTLRRASSHTLAGITLDTEEKSPVRVEETPGEDADVDAHVYPDGGYGWIVLGCCVTWAACTMGQGFNFGVYQDFYVNHTFPGIDSAWVSVTGTINAFFLNFTAFFSGRMGDRYGYKRVLYLSIVVSWLGMFLASRSNQMWQLFICQGLITGIGQGMSIPLIMSLPSQWFFKRRGFASGLALSGAGMGGGVSTLIVRQLLSVVGYKKTLLIMACTNLFFSVLATILIKTRPTSPEARGKGRGPWADKVVLRKSEFWSLTGSLVVATLGYGTPWIYLQQWVATTVPGTSPILTALPATILSFSLSIGRALVGLVSDHLGPLNTYVLVFAGSAVVQYSLWLTASTYSQICVFAVVYGLIAPGFLGLIPQMVIQLLGPANLASNVGVLILFNGPGNLGMGPLAGAIYDASGRTTFKYVIITDGALQFAGALIACWARWKGNRKLFVKV